MQNLKIKIGDIITFDNNSTYKSMKYFHTTDFKAKIICFHSPFKIRIEILSGSFGYKNRSDYENSTRIKGYKSFNMPLKSFKLYRNNPLYKIY